MYGILFIGRPLRAPQAGRPGCCCYRASSAVRIFHFSVPFYRFVR